MKKKTMGAIWALMAALALAGCGGGGGGSGGSGGKVNPPTGENGSADSTGGGGNGESAGGGGSTAPSTLVTQVTAPTYGAGEVHNAYTFLNSQRQLCGFGLLQQNTKLDTAAQGHSDYLRDNNVVSHFQQVGKTGFSGEDPGVRATAAGYAYSRIAEVAGASMDNYGSTHGKSNVMDLFMAPYHGMGILASTKDIGVGVSANNPPAPGAPKTYYAAIKMGIAQGAVSQLLAGNEVKTYPCNGTDGVLSKSYHDEDPAPITGRNLRTQPIGHPIYLMVRDNQKLVVFTAELKEFGGNPLTLRQLNSANDQNSRLLQSEVVMIPDAPLKINTNYQFSATGTNNGTAFSTTFTFKTGAF